ncbi:MAG: hypothetical protein AAF747_06325, partial [Planctomycetota bacterium]
MIGVVAVVTALWLLQAQSAKNEERRAGVEGSYLALLDRVNAMIEETPTGCSAIRLYESGLALFDDPDEGRDGLLKEKWIKPGDPLWPELVRYVESRPEL